MTTNDQALSLSPPPAVPGAVTAPVVTAPVVTAPVAPAPVAPAEPARRETDRWRRLGLVSAAYLASLLVFGALAALKGANPLSVYHTMISSTLFNGGSLQQTLLRAVPIALAALAVSIPARAGLVNVGGEGQLIAGAIAATGTGLAVGDAVPGPVSWLAMAAAGAAAGAAWAGLAAVMRTKLGANEAVSTLLLNFVANDAMLYLIYQPWKDPHGSGQPQSRPLSADATLPKLFGSQLNLGIVAVVVLAIAVWWLLTRTSWGFALRVVGGNPEAARRAGLPVNRLLVSAMATGGALAGIGGALNLAGVETQLRPDITLTFGYVAFLASFLGRHQPFKVVAAAVLFSAIALSGNGLQLTDGLDGTTVDILLGLIVMAPLALSHTRRRTA